MYLSIHLAFVGYHDFEFSAISVVGIVGEPVRILPWVVLVMLHAIQGGHRIYDNNLFTCNPSANCFIVSVENFLRSGGLIAKHAVTHDNTARLRIVVLFGVVFLVEHLPLHEVVTLGQVETDSVSL